MRLNTPTIDSMRNQASQLADRLPIPGRTAKATRRVTARKAGLGVLVLGALAGAGFAATRKRYNTGTANVIETTATGDGRLVVLLDNNVIFVVDGRQVDHAKSITTPDAHVAYRVNRVNIGGIPSGMVYRDTDNVI